MWHCIHCVVSCGCRCCVLILIEEQFSIFQYSVVYLIGGIFLFDIPGTQYTVYLVANTWNTLVLATFCWCFIHLCLRVLFVRVLVVMTRPPKHTNVAFLRLFSPPLPLSLSTFWVLRYGNDNDRYRYRYRCYVGLIAPIFFLSFDIQHWSPPHAGPAKKPLHHQFGRAGLNFWSLDLKFWDVIRKPLAEERLFSFWLTLGHGKVATNPKS